MTSTTYLATSVEASRLRYVEINEEFFRTASAAERRALDLSHAAKWSPALVCEHIGADKFIVAAEVPGPFGSSFVQGFRTPSDFYSVRSITPLCLFVRCNPGCEFIEQAEKYVLENTMLGFLPF